MIVLVDQIYADSCFVCELKEYCGTILHEPLLYDDIFAYDNTLASVL